LKKRYILPPKTTKNHQKRPKKYIFTTKIPPKTTKIYFFFEKMQKHTFFSLVVFGGSIKKLNKKKFIKKINFKVLLSYVKKLHFI
jgi:hypothetical protein